MKKFLFIIFTILLDLSLFVGAVHANYNNLSNTGIDKFNNASYSRIEMMKGYEFANKIKQAVRNKDIYFFANNMPHYPIGFYDENYNENNHIVIIKSKEQFIDLYKEKLFTKDFVNHICNDELFVSSRGFMMGHGEIWFDYDEDSQSITPKITRIIILNYSNYSVDEDISWVKVGEGIYYDPKSYTILTDGICGTFKIDITLKEKNLEDSIYTSYIYDEYGNEKKIIGAYLIQTIKIFPDNTYMIINEECIDKHNNYLNIYGSSGYQPDYDTAPPCDSDELGRLFYKVLRRGDY